MKREMKAVYFTVGLLLGLALIVTGIVRVATADWVLIRGRSQEELKEEISSLVEDISKIREERGEEDPELLDKEIKLSDSEAELAKVQQGFYAEREGAVWLENLPVFIAGVFAIGVAVVIYKYA